MQDFIERTVIKLQRAYGKDELVAHLNKKISEKDIEIEAKKNNLFTQVQAENKLLRKLVSKLRSDNRDLINKSIKITK
jgi:DNA helicase TIP49 (TBP-interacting protein)